MADPPSPDERRLRRAWRRASMLAGAHALGAAAWAYAMAGGFALDAAKGLANRVLPGCVLVLALVAGGAAWRRRPAGTVAGVAVWCGLWAGLAVAAWWWFPFSRRRIALLASVALGSSLLAAWGLRRVTPPRPRDVLLVVAGGLTGITAGAVVARLLRAPPPATRPAAGSVPEHVRAFGGGDWSGGALRLSDAVWVAPDGGVVGDECAGAPGLIVRPALAFESRSPDRTWTAFAPSALRAAPPSRVEGVATRAGGCTVAWTDGGTHWLDVVATTPERLVLEAWSQLDAPVWAHLATSTEIVVTGCAQLTVVLAPCAELALALPARGEPSRFAWLGGGGVLHVSEATHREKGPFVELAKGRLARGAPLVLTLRTGGHAFARLTLLDWSAQASTAPSPTAGYGVPQNAIELLGTDDGGVLFVTLAATSVGRGFDSVGYRAGAYRNRVMVERLR